MTTRILRSFAAAMGLSMLAQLPAAAQSGYTFQSIPMPASGGPWQVRDNLTFVSGNYIWTKASGFTNYNYPGAARTQLVGLNDSGYVLGQAYPNANSGAFQPFLLFGGNATNIPAGGISLSDGLLTTSYSSGNTSSTGYIIQANTGSTTSFPIPGVPNYGTTLGINDNGQVVGQYMGSNGFLVNYIRNTDGTLTTWTTQATGGYLHATAIANGPLVAGFFSDNASGTNFGYVRSANGTNTTFQIPYGSIRSAPRITNSGVVIGGATSNDGTTSVIFFAYPPGYTGPKAF